MSKTQEAVERAFQAYEKIFYNNYCRRICGLCHKAYQNADDPGTHLYHEMARSCPLIRFEAYLALVVEHGHAYASEHLTEEAIEIAKHLTSEYHRGKPEDVKIPEILSTIRKSGGDSKSGNTPESFIGLSTIKKQSKVVSNYTKDKKTQENANSGRALK
jgi:hypothetical protein